MLIAIASGKGGTGKTTVAVNLACVLSSSSPLTLADCDVEEPNAHLFFPGSGVKEPVTLPVPVIDPGRCDYCGKCGLFCQYGALIVLKERVLQYPQLCHSCGGCRLVCPTHAISERPEQAGTIERYDPTPSLHLVTGRLAEGSIHTPTVIRAVRDAVDGAPLVLLDAPPGTACAAMETLQGCDFCLMVTEPTPFGLHDLRLICELARLFRIPAGVVINRCDDEDTAVEAFCREQDLPVLMRIPFDRTIALMQGSSRIISRDDPVWRDRFRRLGRDCLAMAGGR